MRTAWLAALLCCGVLGGCYIEQDPGPAYPTGSQRIGEAPAPGAANAAVVEGDTSLDPGSLSAGVSSVATSLAGCLGAPGQVELVVRIDADGRPIEVQGPGDATCLLAALRQAPLPRPTQSTVFRVALWLDGSGQSQDVQGAEGEPGTAPAEPAATGRDVFLVTIASVRVDPLRPDGRPWDAAEDVRGLMTPGSGRGAPPDLFVRLLRNGEEVLKSATVRDSPAPDFDAAAGRSLRLGPADQIVFEILDDDAGSPELLARFRVPAPGPRDLERGSWEIGPSPPMQRLSIRLAPPRTLVGTGVRWERRRGSLVVLEVAPDSPAARAGVRTGDRILTVDGQRARSQGDEELEGLFRGAVGSRMRLELERDGQRLDVELERAIVYY